MLANSEHYWTVVLVGLTPLVLWASWIDYKERRVPNYLNLFIAVTGLIVQTVFNRWSGLLSGAEGLCLGLALLIIPWAMHMMGAGDVKLLAGIGAWVGPQMVLWSFLIGAIIGGIASLVMIAMKGRWSGAWQNFQLAAVKCTNSKLMFSDVGSVKSLGSNSQLIPYGVPLTAGTLIVMTLKSLCIWQPTGCVLLSLDHPNDGRRSGVCCIEDRQNQIIAKRRPWWKWPLFCPFY